MTSPNDSLTGRASHLWRSSRGASKLAAAIAFAAALYFLVHLHRGVGQPPYGVMIYNTVTGSVVYCHASNHGAKCP